MRLTDKNHKMPRISASEISLIIRVKWAIDY